jgi:RNA polymerase sigma-70 factor (ECF subfamily)
MMEQVDGIAVDGKMMATGNFGWLWQSLRCHGLGFADRAFDNDQITPTELNVGKTHTVMNETRQSLLLRAQTGEEDAWKDLTDLYRPLIIGWLNRQGVPAGDLEDLTQEVLLTMVKHLPAFEHSGQRGAFRAWLRTIICSRTVDYWRGPGAATQAEGGSGATAALQQIADPDSDLNRQWDQEHDRYVLDCMLDLLDEEFEPATMNAFRLLALDGASGAKTAEELGMSISGVYVAKSRVLQRIRALAEGLID